MTSHECTGYTEENLLKFNDAQNFADWMKTGGNAKFHIIILFFRFFFSSFKSNKTSIVLMKLRTTMTELLQSTQKMK